MNSTELLQYDINNAFNTADERLAAAAKRARELAEDIERYRARIAEVRSKPLQSAHLLDVSAILGWTPGPALSLLNNMRLDLIANSQAKFAVLAHQVRATEPAPL